MDDRSILELRQLCTSGGLAQDSLASLIDAELSVPALVKSEAAAMANAKRAGLALAERNKLREALRKHKDTVLSAVEPHQCVVLISHVTVPEGLVDRVVRLERGALA